jgi:hypothetical protein
MLLGNWKELAGKMDDTRRDQCLTHALICLYRIHLLWRGDATKCMNKATHPSSCLATNSLLGKQCEAPGRLYIINPNSWSDW